MKSFWSLLLTIISNHEITTPQYSYAVTVQFIFLKMPQVNTLSMGCKFKFNNELSSKPQIIYNTRARVKQKRKKRSTNPSNLNTKIEQVRLNNFYNEEISSDDEIFLKNSNNSKCVWTKNNDNDDFFTPLDLWADQINPFISYPLCILDHTPNQHNNISTKYPIIFVNNISLHNLLSELSSQIPQIEDELFCDFDWDKVH